MNIQETLDLLADNGILIFVVYGNAPAGERYFSVSIYRLEDGPTLEKPLQATSFVEAVEIAYQEAKRLEWV